MEIVDSVWARAQGVLGLRSVEAPKREVDYLKRVPGPSRLIEPNGEYVPGWFEDFSGEFNFEDSGASPGRFQKWFHIHFETERYFVVANIAHLGAGGNVAVLLHDKTTGETKKSSKTSYLFLNRIRTDQKIAAFEDPASGSFISLRDDGGVQFSVKTPELIFTGSAAPCLGKPFTQCTAYGEGRGTLQRWGNLQLVEGEVVGEAGKTTLEAGAYGAYDTTCGHRPRRQNWNWFSVVGDALCEATGEVETFSLQVSRDQERASPRIHSQKYNLWLCNEHCKFSEFTFDYTSDPQTRETKPWSVFGASKESFLTLTFSPFSHRREKKWWPGFLEVDFNQYYGEVSGRIVHRGRTYRISEVFAVAEDSWMCLKV